MAGKLTASQRAQFGYSKNKLANLQDKADAIKTITYIAAYGTHIFYVWHEKETVDMESAQSGKPEKIMKETMSPEERKRLMTSVDIVLYFSFSKGKYAITVGEETRGYAEKPNTGFTIYDRPGNYWRKALPRLYSLIYTTFSGQDEAVNWGLQALGKEDPVELGAFYDEVRGRANPKQPGDMWVAWMLAIEEKYNAAQKRIREQKEQAPIIIEGSARVIENSVPEALTPKQALTAQKVQDALEDHPVDVSLEDGMVIVRPDNSAPETKDSVPLDPLEKPAIPNGDSVDNNGEPLTYKDRDLVREEYVADYKIYQNQFGYAPESEANMLRAKEAMGEDWK
jgi:hypothetical protein